MEPGVSGVQWLPMPPGNENSLKNSRIPSSSSPLFGYTSEYVPSRYAGASTPWRAVAGAGEEDGVEVVLVDQTIEMNVGEAQAGARAPVPQEPLLDVPGLQRLPEQRVLAEVNHAGRQVRARSPGGVCPAEHLGRQPRGRRPHSGRRA